MNFYWDISTIIAKRVESVLYYKKHLIVPFSTYLLNPFKECTKEMAYGLIPMYHIR